MSCRLNAIAGCVCGGLAGAARRSAHARASKAARATRAAWQFDQDDERHQLRRECILPEVRS